MNTFYRQSVPQAPAENRLLPIPLSPKENRNYSLVRAIEGARSGNHRNCGFERECTLEIQNRMGDLDQHAHSLFVPASVLAHGQRDLTAGTASAGGYLVETEVAGVLDFLRPKSVALGLGAQVLTGLQGNQAFARTAGTATITWLANEGSTATESTQTLGQLTLAPKTVSGYVERSRQHEMQAGPLGEQMLRRDLIGVLMTAFDAAVFNGSGVSGEPTGILNVAGIGTFTGASLAYAGVLEAQTDILNANALSAAGEVSFVCRPAVASLLANRQGFSSTAPMWAGALDAGQLASCRARSTMNVPAATLVACDFTQILIAEWGPGAVEIRVNPYATANFQAGIKGIAAFLTIDVGMVSPLAASVATSVS